MWDSLVDYQNKRATVMMLSRLSDKELADIGISRYNIHEMVFGDETNEIQSKRSWQLHQTRYAETSV
jgi:hypothetical protein